MHADAPAFPVVPIRGTTRIVGVLGYPVAHSASPPMHNAAFAQLGLDWAYIPLAVAPETIGDALRGVRAFHMAGVNVTVPLKELVAPFLDELTPRAKLLGAVNTVVNRDGKLFGDSTDGPGFIAALAHANLAVGPTTRAVVLGAGGSARAVVYALAELGAHVTLANRTPERAQAVQGLVAPHVKGAVALCAMDEAALADALQTADVLVNTTSVGMHPKPDEMPPVPAHALRPGLLVSDLIYKPGETRLLLLAGQNGCQTQNGIEMLVRQGALAFSQWTGIAEPPLDVMRRAVQTAVYGDTAK